MFLFQTVAFDADLHHKNYATKPKSAFLCLSSFFGVFGVP